MKPKNVIMEVNANFHRMSGKDTVEQESPSFSEYRRKWKEWPENFHAGEFPLFIDIEATNACNLRCDFCATTFIGNKMKKGYLDYGIVKRIVDEGAGRGLYGIKFNIRGEPLLHPQIHEFVRYAKMKGLIDVYFNTNAMLLTETMSKKLIDAGLDRLSISFEGYTKPVYEKYRVGAVYETVLSNIENMQSLKKRLGVGHPKIRVQTVMLPDVVSGFDEYKKFWSSRADEVGLLDYKEMKTKKKGLKYPWACPQIWQRMAVWWDGTILPCNHDDDGLLALGNVQDITIKEAWRSGEVQRIRGIHRKGVAHKISACDGCYLRDSEISKHKAKENQP